MINFWTVIHYVIQFFSYIILRKKERWRDREKELTKSNLEAPDCQTKSLASETDNCIKSYSGIVEEQSSSIAYQQNKYFGIRQSRPWDLVLAGPRKEFIMKRNYVRRNSKRFVIGDSEDDLESPTLPDVTITDAISEFVEEPPRNVWIKENSQGKLSVKATLT